MAEGEIEDFDTLKEALSKLCINTQNEIPLIVRLLENPKSPVALPGKISLFDHDCLHILLNRGLCSEDEAFVIGFTMGNDPRTKIWHLKVFKIFSKYLYPSKYRFVEKDFLAFDLGFDYGKSITTQLNKINFFQYKSLNVAYLRKVLGIEEATLKELKSLEKEHYTKFSKK